MKNNIQLYINNQLVDTFNNDLGIRINNVLNDPTKLIPSLGEYSFTFKLPVTKTNAHIFNNAHIPEKKNKFNIIYDAQLYANDILLFNGNLSIQSSSNKEYNCNLYKNKTNQLEAIFNDEKLNEFDWLVPFNGIDTINEINADNTSEYYFPLVCYQPFDKVSIGEKYNYKLYTPKDTIDNTNRWYYTSFLPSFNLSSLLKHLFKDKGYNLSGDIITDNVLKEIYLSSNLANDQHPIYNYGNEKIGRCTFTTTYTNAIYKQGATTFKQDGDDYIITNFINPTNQLPLLNYDVVKTYNLIKYGQTNVIQNNGMMLNENAITIPEDGWYEITADTTMGIDNNQIPIQNLKPEYYNMPLEFHLLKYTQNDNESYINHNPIYYGEYPNEEYKKSYYADYITNNPKNNPNNTNTTLVDKYNNPNFICGLAFTKYSQGLAYIKNGNSWNDPSITTEAIYNSNNNYYIYNKYNQIQQYKDYNQTLIQSTEQQPQITNNKTIQGKNHIVIKLQRNDIIIPYVTSRAFEASNGAYTTFHFNVTTTIDVRALAPATINRNKLQAQQQSLFNKELNLSTFCNNQTTKQQFINNILQSFNLTVTTDNTTHTAIINKNKQHTNTNAYVDIDDRTTTKNYNHQAINFPKNIGVQLTTNEDERYIYLSAEKNATDEQLQLANWTSFSDIGYDLIDLNGNGSENNIISSTFAYTYTQPFTYNNTILDIPIQDYQANWATDNYDDIKDGLSLPQRFWFRNNVTNDTLTLINNTEYNITIPINNKVVNNKRYYADYYNKPNSMLDYFFNVNLDTRKSLTTVECHISPTEYSMLTKGANVKMNDDIYICNKIDGYDPSNNNTTKLTLMN